MWKTTAVGIAVMQYAADAAYLGSAREDALDALNSWIGPSVRLKLTQTVSDVATVVYEATRSTAGTRSGETLTYPSTGWTVVTNVAADPTVGTFEVRIEDSTYDTVYIRHAVGASDAIQLSGAMNGTDELSIACVISAKNIQDFEQIPGAPNDYAYLIYDNPALPVDVSAGLVGMHIHRYPYSDTTTSPEPTYGYGTAILFNTDGCAWNAIETSAGTYDWTAMDAIVAYHYAAGRKILWVIQGCPTFYGVLPSHPSPYGIDGFGSAPSDWTKLSDFVTAALTRYSGKITAVMGPKEPDLGWYDYYTGSGGTDLWIGSVEGNSTANKLQRKIDYVHWQKVIYDAAKAISTDIDVYLGGLVFWSDDGTPNNQVIDLGTTAYDGVEAKDLADVLGFHHYGSTTDVSASDGALERLKTLAATRAALRPGLRIALDEVGTLEYYGTGFSTTQHIQVIKQDLLLGAAFGLDVVGLYAHEDYDTLGDPSTNSDVATAIDDMYTALAGLKMVRGYVLNDGTVWLAFSDGSTLQSPGGTYTPPTPTTRDLTEHPFSDSSFWNIQVGAGATFSNDTATSRVVSSGVGLNLANWSIPVGKATYSNSLKTIYVAGPSGTKPGYVTINFPSGLVPSPPTTGSGGDAHMVVIDPNGQIAHEFYHVDTTVTPWRAYAYVAGPLDSSGIGYMVGYEVSGNLYADSYGWTGCIRAYGGSGLGGLIRAGELNAGLIEHAIGFACNENYMTGPWVWPATRDDANYKGSDVQTGMCFAIPPSVDLDALAISSSWSAPEKAIAVALQDYGSCVIDKSGSTCMYGEQTERALFPSINGTHLNQIWALQQRITNNTAATPKGGS